MDEADALAQRIGIMAAGKLRVLGSPQHLKSTHGGGYKVELKAPPDSEGALTQLVHDLFTEVKPRPSHQGTLVFEVAAGFRLASVFGAFEASKESLGLETFTMSQTTLEEVFLRVAELYRIDAKKQKRLATPIAAPGAAAVADDVDDVTSPVTAGWYTNGWINVFWKITPTPQTQPPAYRTEWMCCLLNCALPIPCCCCPPGEFTLQEANPEAPLSEQGVATYTGGNSVVGKEHIWTEDGKFWLPSSKEKMRIIARV